VIQCHRATFVYTGSTDVFALFAKPHVLTAVWDLRQPFQEAMAEFGASISGAMVYAHIHALLSAVVADVQHRLDAEAKERSGRDALTFGQFSSVKDR